MKVWHITKLLYGGSGQYALRLHNALLARGVDSNLLLLQGAEPPRILQMEKTGRALDRSLTKVIRGVSRRVANAPFHSLLGRERYQSSVRIDGGDIVHLHGLTGWMGLAGLADLVPQGARIFWTLHDLWPLTGGCVVYRGCHRFSEACTSCPVLRSGFSAWARMELRIKERLVRTRAIQPVANSRWTAARISESRVFRGALTIPVIPPIIDDAFMRPSTHTLREELGIAPETKVLCVGARAVTDEYKGIHDFLLALGSRHRRDTPLDVLLYGEGEIEEIEGLRIHVLGKVEDPVQMAAIYRTCDLYVSPSLMETFGMSIAEAQACGTTVAGYLVGGVKDAVWPGDAGNFVPLMQIDSLMAVVEKALATDPLARVNAASRAKWVADNFTGAVISAAQEAIYTTSI